MGRAAGCCPDRAWVRRPDRRRDCPTGRCLGDDRDAGFDYHPRIAVGAHKVTQGSRTFFGVPRVTGPALALGAALVFIVIARFYRESRHGLFARAARDDPDAASALGIDPRRTRFISWCLSGTMATVAGALYGHMLGAFSPASFYLSLVFAHVAMMIVGGMASVGGAVVGVTVVTLLQDTARQFEGGAEIFGIAAPKVFGLTTVGRFDNPAGHSASSAGLG